LNPGLRLIAKLCLNSLWGKLAQQTNAIQNAFVTSRKDLIDLFSNEKLEILSEFFIDEESMMISYKCKDDSDAEQGNTSVAIAAFVTCCARLQLYSLMEKIESLGSSRLLYCDTDSVIYVRKFSETDLHVGNYLGELTNEISTGTRCVEGIFLGPKSYALRMIDGQGEERTIIKIKGISLHSAAGEIVSFDSLHNTVDQASILHVPQNVFLADRNTQVINSLDRTKKLAVTSDKRVFGSNYSLPYGFTANSVTPMLV